MTAPYVGLPTAPGAGCAFAPDIATPACGAPPTHHLRGHSPAWGDVALSACADHAPLAFASLARGTWHPHVGGCEVVDCWSDT